MGEIRLLGPVEVWAGGRLLPTGQPRQRSVLAALAADAGRLVSWDTLIYRVWGESPPNGVSAALYSYVTRLRQLLRQAGLPEALHRGQGGYVLRVVPEVVDLHRFRALAMRDDFDRAATLREALSLWHGSALSGIAGQWASRMREGWRQERTEAVVAWAQAEHQAGRPSIVIGQLTEMLAENPLVEPLAFELIRALCATGRRAEALECFAATRRHLVDELGAEPGAELHKLHQEILRGDGFPTAAAQEVPAQLPRNVPCFRGRSAELAWLQSGAQIAVLAGPAGIGKTTLAVHWAHMAADRFPDGQLFIDLRGFDHAGAPTGPSAAIRTFLDALGVAPQRIPSDLDAQAALYRTRLAGRRMLVILDNAHDAEQVRPLLPGTSSCLVVVTSRHQLTGLCAAEGAHLLTLDLLSTVESRELLAARLGADRVASDPDAIEEIIDLCARLPLALAIAAARADSRPQLPLAAIAADMRDMPGRLDSFRTADPGTDLRAVFSWSQRHLTPKAARLFRLLGLPTGPDISLAAAASLAFEPVNQTRLLLTELCEAHLITERSPGRFALHDLLRAYAAEEVLQDDWLAAKQRLLEHYLHHAHAADQLLNPFRDPIALPGDVTAAFTAFTCEQEALDWLAAEHHCLLATASATDTWQLGYVLAHYLYRRGYWLDQVATGRAALTAAQRTGDPTAQTLTGVSLARAYVQLSDLDSAEEHLLEVLKLGEPDAEAHHVLSWVHDLKGSRDDAFAHALQAFELFRAAEHLIGQARAMNTIGWFHAKNGDHHLALSFCEPALRLHEKLGNTEGQAATWHSIGYAHHHLGRHRQALNCYRQALILFRGLGNRYFEGNTLASIGDTHHALGEHASAHSAWELSLVILDELTHPEAQDVRARLSRSSTSGLGSINARC